MEFNISRYVSALCKQSALCVLIVIIIIKKNEKKNERSTNLMNIVFIMSECERCLR